ncbi:hypothetical protein NM208_g6368 [Fusarium decemcellulare]|uniref:Uncharacterized protein n=1 Tax=Fusarium decemcellulare TaxID=57161 RepID=A0ACC1SD91_9HYPO|nr:hypothetical protein NM208_g6368 [Fusarium decemcellulare]
MKFSLSTFTTALVVLSAQPIFAAKLPSRQDTSTNLMKRTWRPPAPGTGFCPEGCLSITAPTGAILACCDDGSGIEGCSDCSPRECNPDDGPATCCPGSGQACCPEDKCPPGCPNPDCE